jgi:hypothetical protein
VFTGISNISQCHQPLPVGAAGSRLVTAKLLVPCKIKNVRSAVKLIFIWQTNGRQKHGGSLEKFAAEVDEICLFIISASLLQCAAYFEWIIQKESVTTLRFSGT